MNVAVERKVVNMPGRGAASHVPYCDAKTDDERSSSTGGGTKVAFTNRFGVKGVDSSAVPFGHSLPRRRSATTA